MNLQEQIDEYINSQPEPKRSELQTLHDLALQVKPDAKLMTKETVLKIPPSWKKRAVTEALRA